MKTTIGIDYGTQSARAVLADVETGEVLCSHSVAYPHGVMEGALADVGDYLDALDELLFAVTPPTYRDTVIGICVDATSLTLVPLDTDGQPLACCPAFAAREQAQIKLWKRHTAQPQAEEALALAKALHEPFLGRTGGAVSSEWTLPKLLEMYDVDREVYDATDRAMDLCEFLTFRLTGIPARSVGSMGFKGLWAPDLGFPSDAFLDGLRPGFAQKYRHLLRGDVKKPCDRVGFLRPELCARYGLSQNVAVAAGVLDGHTGLVTLGALQAGDAALVVGTSNVLTIQTEGLCEIEGICGIAADGLTPGLYGIDSGQSGTGDMLAWYIQNALPGAIEREAAEKGVSPYQLLESRVVRPWENPITAADWWNGSRNAPCDLRLRGAISGLSLDTRPEDIYLALLQAIACGTREIIEQCAGYGVRVERVYATGGITEKSPLLMREYANLLGLPMYVGRQKEGPALGAAMLAAVAAGQYATPQQAYAQMGVRDFTEYHPDPAHRDAYEALYQRNHALRLSQRSTDENGV